MICFDESWLNQKGLPATAGERKVVAREDFSGVRVRATEDNRCHNVEAVAVVTVAVKTRHDLQLKLGRVKIG